MLLPLLLLGPALLGQLPGKARPHKDQGAQTGEQREEYQQRAGVGAGAPPPPDASPHLLHWAHGIEVPARCCCGGGAQGGEGAGG